MRKLIAGLLARVGFVESKPGDWMDATGEKKVAAAYGVVSPEAYDADEEFEKLATESIPHPVVESLRAVKEGKAVISEAYLLSGRWDVEGRLVKEPGEKLRESLGMAAGAKPYRVERVSGETATKALVEAGGNKIDECRKGWLATVALREAAHKKAKDAGLVESDFDFDTSLGAYDSKQYTEYTPIMGGPHFKQLYLYDYLTQHARAFEAWNHNPVAKRIINIIVQYSLGRGYKAVSTDDKKQKAWDDFERKFDIKRKVTRFWGREFLIYGELMVDKKKWQSIDPSTVWDIITDPDDIDDVYYYHQQYPTAYATFTGKQVPGVSGSANVKPIEYIVRQLPWDQVLHIKAQVVSNEKRGRSFLFPVLGWCKRVKDLYNAEVIGAWLSSSFIWDDEIDGSDADITAHLAKYSSMPTPGSIFAHNKAIKRQAVAPAQASGSRTGKNTAAEIMAFIATAMGIPKEHFNISAQGGGSRAAALTSAEPFTKVIEEVQSEFEDLLTRMAEVAMSQAGIENYQPGDIEFVFPSVTKDTTTEAVGNIMAGEAAGFIGKETAGNMYAAEMNITTYDYDKEQKQIADAQKADMARSSGFELPGGRKPVAKMPQYSDATAPALDGSAVGDDGGSEIHGKGKVALSKSLKTL